MVDGLSVRAAVSVSTQPSSLRGNGPNLFPTLALLLYAATMGLAGFLLFLVQPMLAKFILPWFGGSAGTWTVCMLFFQTALLAGYAYAYAVTTPLPLKTQAALQIAIAAAACLFLPITPSAAFKPLDAADPTCGVSWAC